MTWTDRLVKEAEDIIKHGDGKLELFVNPLGGYKTLVKIECGKSYRFQVDKVIDD